MILYYKKASNIFLLPQVWIKFKGKAEETLHKARNKMEMIEERLENGEEEQGTLRRLMKEIRVRTRDIVK